MANNETLSLVKEFEECVKNLVADMHAAAIVPNHSIPIKIAEAYTLRKSLELFVRLRPEATVGNVESLFPAFDSLYHDLCEAVALDSNNLSWASELYENFKVLCELTVHALERTPRT